MSFYLKIKLKKEIHNLREHNADLQMDLEEKNQKLGKMAIDQNAYQGSICVENSHPDLHSDN